MRVSREALVICGILLVACVIAVAYGAAVHWALQESRPERFVIQAEDDPVPCKVKQAPDGIQRVNGVLVATCE